MGRCDKEEETKGRGGSKNYGRNSRWASLEPGLDVSRRPKRRYVGGLASNSSRVKESPFDSNGRMALLWFGCLPVKHTLFYNRGGNDKNLHPP